MAQLVASKRLTMNGQTFEAGQPIPSESVRSLSHDKLKKLQDNRFVHEDSTRVSGSKKER